MKKRAISIVMLLLLTIVGITGCQTRDNSQSRKFNVIIYQNSEKEIYGIHYEYYIANKPIGGCEKLPYSDNSILVGEKITLTFDDVMLQGAENISKFKVEVFIIDENGQEHKTETDIKLNAEWGKDYEFNLKGNSPNYSLEER